MTRVEATAHTAISAAASHHVCSRETSTPSAAATGTAVSVIRAGVTLRTRRGSASEAASPPAAQAP